jgi:putative NIF3 family GTP cyclohydrolase 1 type 2
MKAKEVLRRLTKAIPKDAEWSKGEPYGGQGIDPKADIQRILYCVTPTGEVVEHFEKGGYDLLVSHHPFVTNVPQAIFHTALDCCEGGLNDQWRDALAVLDPKHFDGTLGWHGRIEPVSFSALVKRCEAFIGHPIVGQAYSEIETVESVVICSGLGGLVTDLARATKADCYILGEATQSAASMGFKAVIEIGHTLSERMGINVLRAALPELEIDPAPMSADRFGREVYAKRKVS